MIHTRIYYKNQPWFDIYIMFGTLITSDKYKQNVLQFSILNLVWYRQITFWLKISIDFSKKPPYIDYYGS